MERVKQMAKNVVIYWSMSGNTEAMANEIVQGIKNIEDDVVLLNVADATPEDVKQASTVVLGCPAMGDEVLEDSEFQPFYDAIQGELAGKNVACFGSYGWGDGQWMRDFETSISETGAHLIEAGWINNDGDFSEGIAFGERVAKA